MRLRHVLAFALLAAAGTALGQDLNLVSAVDVKDEGSAMVLTVTGSKPPNFTTFSMADPPRFVIDLSEAKFQGVAEEMPQENSVILVVKNLSYGSDATSIARIMIGFAVDVEPPDVQAQGTRLVVRIAKPAAAGKAVAQAGTNDRAREQQEAQRRAEAESQARAEAQKRAEAEAAVRADAERAEAERVAQAAAGAQARAEAERRAQAEAQALADEQEKARAAEQERLAADAKAREEKERAAGGAQASQAEAERRAHEEAAARAKAELEAELRADADRKAQQDAAEAKAREDAGRRAQDDAQAKLATDADQKATEEAHQAELRKAQEDFERQREEAIASAKAEAERNKQAEADRTLDAKRQKEDARAAAKAERERKKQEEADRKADAKRQRLEAIAAAKAEKEEALAAAKAEKERKKQEAAERRAEAKRQKEEAIAAAKAEKDRKRQEAVEARRQREEAVAGAKAQARGEAIQPGAPSAQLRELGFRQLPGISRVFVRTSVPPRFTIQDVGENLIRIEFENTRIVRRNDARFLDTSFFPSAVAMITPQKRGSSTVVDIKLKQKVPYQQKIEGDMLAIDFERPAGGAAAAPAPGAEAPMVAEPASEQAEPADK